MWGQWDSRIRDMVRLSTVRAHDAAPCDVHWIVHQLLLSIKGPMQLL